MLSVLLCCALGLAACGTSKPRAPLTLPKPIPPRWHWVALPSKDLPLTKDGSRLATATGLGGLDGYDRYREVALAGARGEPAAELMRMEAAALRSRGWRLVSSTVTSGPKAKSKFVPIGTPDAIVKFNGPRDHEVVSLWVHTSIPAVNNDIGPPLQDGQKIRNAVRAHRPVLDVTSAQRSYKPLSAQALS
jgi:hypothetical protein